jgi:cytochrome c
MADEPQGNAANGKKVFARNCANCHNMAVKGKHGIGPLLGNVWGRNIASVKGFKFSAALGGKKGGKWDAEQLEKWLTNPGGFASGTTMAFAGLKNAKDREDVIRYMYEAHPKNAKKK